MALLWPDAARRDMLGPNYGTLMGGYGNMSSHDNIAPFPLAHWSPDEAI